MDPAKIEFNLCIRGDSDWLAPHETDFLRNMTAEENHSMSLAVKRAALAECRRLVALRVPPTLIKVISATPAPSPTIGMALVIGAVAAGLGVLIGIFLGHWLAG